MMLAEKYVMADYNAAKKESFIEGKEEGKKEGKKEGFFESTLRSLLSIIRKTNTTIDDAMDLLDVPERDRESYRKMLK